MSDIEYNYLQNFIAGEWIDATGGDETTLVDPSTERPCGKVIHASPEDVNHAVEAAHQAFPSWSETSPAVRASILEKALAGLEAQAQFLINGMAREIGVPVWFGKLLQIPMPLKNGAIAVETIRTMAWQEQLGPSLVSRVPVGVVAAITPWNAPLHQIVAKVFAALAAGCTVVLKPSELVPSTAVTVARTLSEAGLPPGAFNIVWGGGAIGAALCRHPLVDMVSFTGSEQGGAAVAEAAGRDIKRVVLELGGKSAAILLDDAPLEKAVPTALMQCFANSGQTCVAQSRMLVSRKNLARVEELCQEAINTWVVGDPRDEATRIGPVASAAQYRRVTDYIDRGLSDGARLVSEDPKASKPNSGYFVPPTIFSDVTPSMAIAREEIFGPVMSIMPYDTVEDAVSIANGTPYGLSGSIWSADVGQATGIAKRIRTGQVSLNGAPQNFLAPFGGFKRSGFGRENGRFGVEEFLQYQAIHGATL
jgi:acyl-CoA reductase-like NAD-dependent aldehyde dehydrogenase